MYISISIFSNIKYKVSAHFISLKEQFLEKETVAVLAEVYIARLWSTYQTYYRLSFLSC